MEIVTIQDIYIYQYLYLYLLWLLTWPLSLSFSMICLSDCDSKDEAVGTSSLTLLHLHTLNLSLSACILRRTHSIRLSTSTTTLTIWIIIGAKLIIHLRTAAQSWPLHIVDVCHVVVLLLRLLLSLLLCIIPCWSTRSRLRIALFIAHLVIFLFHGSDKIVDCVIGATLRLINANSHVGLTCETTASCYTSL